VRAGIALAVLTTVLLAACGGSSNPQFEAGILAAATQAGLDIPTWQACRATQAPADRVAQDVTLANAVLAREATPTLVINCERYVGLESLDTLWGEVSSAEATAQSSGVAIDAYYASACSQVPVLDSPVRGSTPSWATLVEFGDFECPYCGAQEPILRQLLADHPEVELVWKNLPLTSVHPHALAAAIAAECAVDQGRFWEMHDAIYQNQGAIFGGD